MPQKLEYGEEHVLSGLLENPSHIRIITDVMSSEDFYFEDNRKVWDKLSHLSSLQDFNNKPLDLALLQQAFTNENAWSGDIEHHVLNLKENVTAPEDVVAVARLLKQHRNNDRQRREIGKLRSLLQNGTESLKIKDLVMCIRAAAEKLCSITAIHNGFNLRSDAKTLLKRSRERNMGLKTGFDALDECMRGLHPGTVTIVASRPSMGKSALVTNIASNMAFNDKKVLFYSLEMMAEEVFERLICSICHITLNEYHTPEDKMDPDMKINIDDAVAMYTEKDFILECPPACSFADIRARFQTEKLIRKPDCLIIDYLQLLKPETKCRSREEEVSQMSWAAKCFAREEQIPVIIVAQLNRANEQGKVRRPMLSDLRESGSLEQDAHNVIFMHREDYYREREGKKKLDKVAEAIVAKNRQGPIGNIKLTFQGKYFLFRNYYG
jgi:replicative DNA helicase